MCHTQAIVNNTSVDGPVCFGQNATVSINGHEISRKCGTWIIPAGLPAWIGSFLDGLSNPNGTFTMWFTMNLTVQGQRVPLTSLGHGDIICLPGRSLQIQKSDDGLVVVPVNSRCKQNIAAVGRLTHITENQANA